MIQVNGGTLGYDEVVDTLSDGLVVIEKVHNAVADGIGLGDIGTLIEVTPRLNEIRQDADTFAAQFEDLTPLESKSVADALAERHGVSADGIVQKALKGLALAAAWYKAVDQVIDLVGQTGQFVKLFRKEKQVVAE